MRKARRPWTGDKAKHVHRIKTMFCEMVPMPFEWITNWAFITFTRFFCTFVCVCVTFRHKIASVFTLLTFIQFVPSDSFIGECATSLFKNFISMLVFTLTFWFVLFSYASCHSTILLCLYLPCTQQQLQLHTVFMCSQIESTTEYVELGYA